MDAVSHGPTVARFSRRNAKPCHNPDLVPPIASRMPPATLALLGANIAVFLLQAQAGPELMVQFALWPPGMAGAPPFEPWQLVSYGFLHGGLTHLLFNMLALYMFGPQIERLFGTRFFTPYYFAC